MPWWVWALAILLALPLGVLLIWRVRHSGPTGFAAALPVLVFERMQVGRNGWGWNLWPIRPLTSTPTSEPGPAPGAASCRGDHGNLCALSLCRSDNACRGACGELRRAAGEAATDAALNRSWRQLEPIFWRAWFQRLRDRLFRRGRKRKAEKDFYRLE